MIQRHTHAQNHLPVAGSVFIRAQRTCGWNILTLPHGDQDILSLVYCPQGIRKCIIIYGMRGWGIREGPNKPSQMQTFYSDSIQASWSVESNCRNAFGDVNRNCGGHCSSWSNKAKAQ